MPTFDLRVKRAAHLSTLNNKFTDTAHEHVLALVVFFIAAKKKKHEFKLGAVQHIVCVVQGEKMCLPQEVEILQRFSWIRGLKLASVEHEQADKIEPTHHGRVTGLLAHCGEDVISEIDRK